MISPSFLLAWCLFCLVGTAEALPFDTVFKGRARFDSLVNQAEAGHWPDLKIGARTATVGRALVGTPYKSYTLEIDDQVEAPSVNLTGLDCWTFFESALAFARMLDEPREKWTPETMLHFIELDRYRDGRCTGGYLSRLHYLEDWSADNDRRGLVNDVTKSLGGVRVAHEAGEMTINWKSYRYLRNAPGLRPALRRMESRVSEMPMYHIPKSKVAAIEGKIQTGDIISVTSREAGNRFSTSHVGLAYRTDDGVLHFMHASAPRNYGKVVVDQRLSKYLYEFSSHAGIMVTRPVR